MMYNTISWRDTTHFDSGDDYLKVVETSVTVNNNIPTKNLTFTQTIKLNVL